MDYDPIVQQQYQLPLKHSRMGIASFIISLAQGFVTLVLIVIAGIMASMGPSVENEAAFMILGLFFIIGILGHIVGIVLGIAGAAQKSRKKVFAVLGLVFNILALSFVALLIVIGTFAEQ